VLIHYALRTRRENRQARRYRAAQLSGDVIHSDRELANIAADYPESEIAATRYAEWAERRSEWDEALSRWAAMIERFPNDPAGYVRQGRALSAAGRFDDADAVLLKTQRRFPKYGGVCSRRTGDCPLPSPGILRRTRSGRSTRSPDRGLGAWWSVWAV
jgi:predicted Zn-dependent protease